ncbi:MAG TPA: dihydrofolate reductase, partial [Actinopolymorphaceae bacterium]
VRTLKREDGKGIWLVGGAGLAGALYDEIDELIVKVNPIVTRTGLPLFAGDFSPVPLALVHHHVLDSGTAFMTYRKAEATR